MANLVMGYWDCPICGTKEIRGDVTNCPSCGRARGEVQFYMKGYNEGETREENERADIEYLESIILLRLTVSVNLDLVCAEIFKELVIVAVFELAALSTAETHKEVLSNTHDSVSLRNGV